MRTQLFLRMRTLFLRTRTQLFLRIRTHLFLQMRTMPQPQIFNFPSPCLFPMTHKMRLPRKGGHDRWQNVLRTAVVAISSELADDWKTNLIILKVVSSLEGGML